MSSYIISKKDYVKAAGVVAGFKKNARNFWIYDYELRRNMTEDDIKDMFVECYELNCMSVIEQYRRNVPGADCNDQNDYEDVFREYKRLTEQAILQGKSREVLQELRFFFHSSLYQTENRAASDRMQIFYFRIIDQILDTIFSRDCNSWGELDLSGIVDESTEIVDIFELCF